MKKKLELSFFSYLPVRVGPLMRLSILIGLMATIQLSLSASPYATKSLEGANDSLTPQQVRVSGTITDATTGEPLIGVNIVLQGTTIGVMTDINGKYTLAVPNLSGILKVSSIGYVNQEISIDGRTVIDAKLVSDVKALDEIVVTGYGTARKTDLTGSVSSVKAAQLTQLPMQRVDQALQGRATGVYILNTDGSPGGNTMIRIRGLNSINGGNEPLIVIDGLQGGSINSINPNDIASMEILKDASATAIYGSRGSNGVILITTKVGKVGKPVIDAGYNIGFQRLARKMPFLNAYDQAVMVNKVRMTDTGQGNIPVPFFTDSELTDYREKGGTDWQDELFGTGVLQTTQLTISGGTEKIKYMVSGNYLDHQGILINSKYDRLSLRANLAADITNWVDFGLNYSYTKEIYKSAPFEQNDQAETAVHQVATWPSTEAVYNADGSYHVHRSGYGQSGSWNPLASAKEPVIDNPTYRNNANLFLNFKILKGLSLKVSGGAQFTNAYLRNYFNTKTRPGVSYNGVGNINESIAERYQNTNILTYDKTSGAHHLTITGVAEQIFETNKGSNMRGRDFLIDPLQYNNIQGAKSLLVSSFNDERSLKSYMGRINYVLFDKYLATVSYRADGSSVFGANNKWAYFPSGSLAWRISQENFLKSSSVISDLKLRVSYGVTGNQGISPYETLARLSSDQYPYDGQTTTQTGFGLSGIANPDLKWESTAQTDIGADISLFKGRLTSTIDVYKKVTRDLLMSRDLPGYVGVGSVTDNIGSIENKGLEILIGGDPLAGEVRWNTTFNFTMNRNKVLNLGKETRIGFTPSTGGYSLNQDFMYLEVGQPFGVIKGWIFEGIWGTDQEAEARSYGRLPGMARYADINGVDANGNIVPGPDGVVDSYDRTNIGYGYPKYTWGWSNLLSYKGIELSFLVIGSEGNQLFNTLRIGRIQPGGGVDPISQNYWTPENQNTEIPGLLDGKYVEEQNLVSKYYFLDSDGSSATSQWIEDASFIKLKTMTLGYSFDQKLIKAIGFQKVRVYITGSNLLTITKYTGYDPEVAAYSDSDATIGVDEAQYPPARAITFGIDITF